MIVSRSLGVVILVCGFVVAGCVVFTIAARPAPSTLMQAARLGDIDVQTRPFSDPRTVQVAIAGDGDDALVPSEGGTITATSCRLGTQITSGSTPVAIDGEPLLALATSTPLWRDLSIGSEGPDVLALQKELNQLGEHLEPDGILGDQSIRAVGRLRGATAPTEPAEVSQADVLWLPSRTATVTTCPSKLGAYVAARSPLITVASPSADVQVSDLPGDLLPGGRTLTVGDQTVALDPSGVLTDSASAALIARATPNQADAQPGDLREVSGTLALIQPVDVGVIPPGSLFDIHDGTACVRSGEDAVEVRLVSSELGETYITPIHGAQLPRRIAVEPAVDRACR